MFTEETISHTVHTNTIVNVGNGNEIADRLRAEAEHKVEGKTNPGIKDYQTGKSDVYRVNPYSLTIEEGWNSRAMDTEEFHRELDELALSIKNDGVKVPLTATLIENKLIVDDGHRRLLATLRAIEHYGVEIMTVPVMMQPRGTSKLDRSLDQVVRNSGKRLSPIEMAHNFKRAISLGGSPEYIANRTGLSVQRVNQIIDLSAAPVEVEAMIKQGLVSATLVQEEMRETKGNDEELTKRITKAVDNAARLGKAKATRKHLGGNGTNLTDAKIVKSMKAILQEAKIDRENNQIILNIDDIEVATTQMELIIKMFNL